MRSRKAVRVLLAVVAAVLLTAARPALADSQVRAVRLSFVEGKVQIDRGEGSGFGPAFMNMPVSQGIRLATGDDGRAEVQLEDGSTIRLVPNTSIYFSKLSLQDSGAKTNVVNVEKGTAYFDAHKHDNDVFEVNAANQQQSVALQRSSRFRIDQGNDQSDSEMVLAVITGAVDVSGAKDDTSPVAVKKGETYKFDPADPSSYYLAKEINPAPFDDWNHDREQYIDQYAYNSPNQASSPYYYGLGDLNYYGNFINVGGYPGSLWRPAYVSPYWSPYADGAWAYYPGFGYSWVSAYPWGWLPYHYGNWVFLPNYGWCWQPGYAWNQWTPVNTVFNPPSGFRPPQPPTRGHGGVVPVGQGPHTIFPIGHGEPGSGPINPNLRRLEANGTGAGAAQVSSGKTAQNSGSATASRQPVVVEPAVRQPSARTEGGDGRFPATMATPRVSPAPRPRSTSPSIPHSMSTSAPSMGHSFGGFSHSAGSSAGAHSSGHGH